MGNVLKKFLGQKIVRTINQPTEFTAREYRVFMAANRFVSGKPSMGALDELGIKEAGVLDLSLPAYFVDEENAYMGIRCSFGMRLIDPGTKKYRAGLYAPNNLFYIKGIAARPNMESILKHFLKLLSSEYAGAVDTQLPGSLGNRYAVILSNAKPAFLYTLLDIATNGDGTTVDYSWIAPLQELIESQEDSLENKSRRKGPKVLSKEPLEYGPPEPYQPDAFEDELPPRRGFSSGRLRDGSFMPGARALSAIERELMYQTKKAVPSTPFS